MNLTQSNRSFIWPKSQAESNTSHGVAELMREAKDELELAKASSCAVVADRHYRYASALMREASILQDNGC